MRTRVCLTVALCVALLGWQGGVSANGADKRSARIEVSVSPDRPTADGEQVTITATIEVFGDDKIAATGEVAFYDGSTLIGSARLTAVTGGAAASFATPLAAGSHALSARYAGDDKVNATVSNPRLHAVSPREQH